MHKPIFITFAFILDYSDMQSRQEAQFKDQEDSLAGFRNEFYLPHNEEGVFTYFCGNSLGLQPRKASEYVLREMGDWARLGVEAHLEAKFPWVKYHEFLSENMAAIVGAKPSETVVMNTLSVNLNLMMVSFYQPTKNRNKILIEYSAFPSDRYAIESQIKFHRYDPKDCLIILMPDEGSEYVRKKLFKKFFLKMVKKLHWF